MAPTRARRPIMKSSAKPRRSIAARSAISRQTTREMRVGLDEVRWFLGGLSALSSIAKLATAAEAAGVDDLVKQMVDCAYLGAVGRLIQRAQLELEAAEKAAA